MDISKILAGIKGKVLDAANFELLQSAYDLQEQNITQLRQNNDALSESQGILKSKTESLEQENENLRAKIAELETQLAELNPSDNAGGLSKAALSILHYCKRSDSTGFAAELVGHMTELGNIESAAAIDELEKNALAIMSSIGMEGTHYSLTDAGKQYVLKMSGE